MERIAEKLSEIEKTARAIVGTKASDGNADAEKEGCI